MEKVKALIGLLVVVGGFYYAWNMIPPYFHNSQFQDDLDDVVRIATYTSRTDDELKAVVLKKAQLRDIVVKEDQVKITRFSGGGLGITVRYHVHVDMIVHPTDLDFTAISKNMNIIAGT
jgi:hypothetical protein